MPDVDASVDFVASIGTALAIGNVTGIDVTDEACRVGVSFEASIDTSHAVLVNTSKVGVRFSASVFDPNVRVHERALVGVSFQASFTYTAPPPSPQPNLPSGQDLSFISYFGQPAMPLCLLPAALGQRPSAQIVYDLETRVVRSQTHMEQRMNMVGEARRTYTFDYVVHPSQQFSVLHIMENCDRFPVVVPLFPELYRFRLDIPIGEQLWSFTTLPEYNLYRATHVMVVDGVRKWGDVYQVTDVSWTYVEGELTAYVEVDPGSSVVYPKGRCALFPCMVGWVDSFEPELVNRQTLTGSLTVREHLSGVSPCGGQE